jgi:hypothetical protein
VHKPRGATSSRSFSNERKHRRRQHGSVAASIRTDPSDAETQVGSPHVRTCKRPPRRTT